MSRAKVDKARELDARIAVEVMGAEWRPNRAYDGHGWLMLNGVVVIERTPAKGRKKASQRVWDACPHFSTDMAAAHLMEAEIERRSTPGSVQGPHVSYMINLACEVGFHGFSLLGWADLFRYQRATPLQRCRAALAVRDPAPSSPMGR